MAWMMDTYSVHAGHPVPGVVTGKPVGIGGSLGRREATGRGVAYLAGRAMDTLGLAAEGATAVVQGYGNVGSVAAQSLVKQGLRVVAVGDATGAIHHRNGLNLAQLDRWVSEKRTVVGFPESEPLPTEELLLLPCDVLVPAAMERQITEANAARLRCRVLAEGANGPTTPEADRILEERGDVFVIPDILCNAGGVVVSYFEWVQDLQSFFWSEGEVMDRLFRILEGAFVQTTALAKRDRIPMRLAATTLGVQRVWEAKKLRGLFP